MNNLIVILKKGNLELFHSAMVSLILDPIGLHKYDRTFLDRIVNAIGLGDILHPDSSIKVRTEFKYENYRFDILLVLDDNWIVFENKVKSIGADFQLSNYRSIDKVDYTIPLGFNNISFSNAYENKILTYETVRDSILDCRPNNKFCQLICDYRDFLTAQILVNSLMLDTDEPLSESMKKIKKSDKSQFHTEENDRRFLLFVRTCKLIRTDYFQGWITQKNHTSGVWIASQEISKHCSVRILKILKFYTSKIWIHIDFYPSLFDSELDNDIAGSISFRLSKCTNNRALHQEFIEELSDSSHGYQISRYPRSNSKTFYLLKKSIYLNKTSMEELSKTIEDFIKILK